MILQDLGEDAPIQRNYNATLLEEEEEEEEENHSLEEDSVFTSFKVSATESGETRTDGGGGGEHVRIGADGVAQKGYQIHNFLYAYLLIFSILYKNYHCNVKEQSLPLPVQEQQEVKRVEKLEEEEVIERVRLR